jgi:hypothetical protein
MAVLSTPRLETVTPEVLVELPWDEVKAFFIARVKQLGKTWFLPG